MTVLNRDEIMEAAKLSPEQDKALDEAAKKKRYLNWCTGIAGMYGLGTFVCFCFAVILLGINDDAAGTFMGMVLLGAVALVVHLVTFVCALKLYDPDELKKLI
jgi:hypothetical protein